MKTVIVPLDGSMIAEQALPYARWLATLQGARVKLLQVIHDSGGYWYPQLHEELVVGAMRGAVGTVQPPSSPHSLETLREQGHAYLDAQAQQHLRGLEVETVVRYGSPAETIVEVAQEVDTIAIVMATHGYSGLRRWTLGSITDKVVHATATPVLAIRATTEPHPKAPAVKRILVPLDGSPLAREVLPFACEVARKTGSELILLTVVPLLTWLTPELMMMPEEADTTEANLRDRLLDDVAPFAPSLREHGVTISSVAAFGASPADTIVDEAQQRGVDLIVMATHGYSGLRLWTLGSVADKVLHATSAPLMLMHAQPNSA